MTVLGEAGEAADIAQKNYFEHTAGKPRPKTDTIKFLTPDETARLFGSVREHRRTKRSF